jgi:hypothetical protein
MSVSDVVRSVIVAGVSLAAHVCVVQAAEPSCDKNHYILVNNKGACEDWATKDAIGPPGAIVADYQGDVYFSSPNIVFKVSPDGTVYRFAGNGLPGYAGDGGPALDALLNFPLVYPEMAADPAHFPPLVGALAVMGEFVYIADAYNNRVRAVDRNGIITTVAGNGSRGAPFWDGGDYGPATSAPITWPQGIAADPQYGDVYIVNAYGQLRWMHADGPILPVAWPNCGSGYAAPGLCAPGQIAVRPAGIAPPSAAVSSTVYIPDRYCRVRAISPYGFSAGMKTVVGTDVISATAGGATCGYGGDAGPADRAQLNARPGAVAVDPAGDLFIADSDNHCIRKVDAATDTISTVVGVCGMPSPVTSGEAGPATPTPVAAVRLRNPRGVAADGMGNLYVADTGNQRVLKVTKDGAVITLAGFVVHGW